MVDLSRLDHGRVGIRNSSGQVLTCRLQDIRRSLVYFSYDLSSFFGHDDLVAREGSRTNFAQQQAQQFVDSLTPGSVVTLGQVHSAQEGWLEATSTSRTSRMRHVLEACQYLGEAVFHVTTVAAVRLPNSVRSLTHREGFASSLTLWWSSASGRSINFLHSQDSKLSIFAFAVQEWKNIRLIQFLLVPGEEEWLASRGGQRIDLLDDVPPATQDASEPSHGRLSTIVEGTEGSQRPM